MHIISKNIKALRLEHGWTQQEMADMLFVTRQTVSNWENGKALPDVETLLQIAEKLDIDVNELVYGKRTVDEQLKKDTLRTLKYLVISVIIYILSRKIALKLQWWGAFYATMIYVPYFTLRPLILFFTGVLLVQLLKFTGVIKKSDGIRNINLFKRTLIFLLIYSFASCFDIVRSDMLLLMYHLKIGQFRNATSFNGMDYALNIPVWLETIKNIPGQIILSGHTFYKPPYYLIIIVLGIAYELAKPYKTENTINDGFYKIKTSLKDIINHPDIYLKGFISNCKETFEFISNKSLFVRSATLLLIVLYALKILTGRFTTLFRKWVYTGITLPLTVFVAGIITAILFKRVVAVYKTDGFRLRKVISVFTLLLLAVSFMVFVPEMAREIVVLLDRVGIITVTGTYDITGWVLTAPLWFDRLNEFFIKINTSSKIWWWAVLGFVNEAAKPYHGKEKYNSDNT